MSDSAAKRVHIVGCHRSGTTLMMELLWYAYAFDGRCEHEASIFRPVPPNCELYLTKQPTDTIRIEVAFNADELLSLICMVRDPRAVATSEHPSFPGVYFSGFRRWLEYQHVIERLARHPRCLLVRYEDLLGKPEKVQAQLEARFPFLTRRRNFERYPEGADVPDRASISLKGTRPFDRDRIGAWRQHLPRVNAQLKRFPEVAEQLIQLGYEPDEGWTECLSGAELPGIEGRKEDRPHFFKRQETRARYWLKTRRYLKNLE